MPITEKEIKIKICLPILATVFQLVDSRFLFHAGISKDYWLFDDVGADLIIGIAGNNECLCSSRYKKQPSVLTAGYLPGGATKGKPIRTLD